MTKTQSREIVSIPDICSGYAHIDGTRVPLWLLVLHQQSGMTTDDLVKNYPSLTPVDLDAVWEYYRHHSLEIDRAIWWQDSAGNVPDGGPVPSSVIVDGILLGVEEDRLREAFEPHLTAEQIQFAWTEYRRNPKRTAPLLQAG